MSDDFIYRSPPVPPLENFTGIALAQELFDRLTGVYYSEWTPALLAKELFDSVTGTKLNLTNVNESSSGLQRFPSPEHMADAIRTELKKAGKDLSYLSPLGRKSASEIEEDLKSAVAWKHVEIARNLYKIILKRNRDNIGRGGKAALNEAIRTELTKGGKDFSALDPGSRRSASEMEQYLDSLLPNGIKSQAAPSPNPLDQLKGVPLAQELFNRLRGPGLGGTGFYSPEKAAEAIRAELTNAGKDLSALDPGGKKSASEMEKAVGSAVATQHLNIARALLKDFWRTSTSPSLLNTMREELKKAGKDFSALDPGGKKSASEMEQALESVVASRKVSDAQTLFYRLCAGDIQRTGRNDPDDGAYMSNRIRQNLTEAGKDLAALDRSGKKSASEMEQSLNSAVAKTIPPGVAALLSQPQFQSLSPSQPQFHSPNPPKPRLS